MVAVDHGDPAEKQGSQEGRNHNADRPEIGVVIHERHGVQAALHAALCIFLVESLVQLAWNGHVLAPHKTSQGPITATMFPCFGAAVKIEPLVDHLPGHE
ncbi:hypothetical protein D3C71_1716580 [compost metagenome]